MMSAMLRYATVLAVLAALGYVVVEQRDNVRPYFTGWPQSCSYPFGWPLVCGFHFTEEIPVANMPPDVLRSTYEINYGRVVVNFVVISTLMGCTIYVARHRLPRLTKRKFSLSSLFIMLTVASFLLVLVKFENLSLHKAGRSYVVYYGTIVGEPPPILDYYPITAYPWWISIPVLYSLACMIIVAFLLTGRLIRQFSSKVPQQIEGISVPPPSLLQR